MPRRSLLHIGLILLGLTLFLWLGVACATQQPQIAEEAGREGMEESADSMAGEAAPVVEAPAADLDSDLAAAERSLQLNVATRLIIKAGQMALEVANTDAAVQSATDIAVAAGGYIISQQLYVENENRFATMQLAVPVEQFETTLRALRGLGRVLSESASGEDVTEEYVDLNARLENLQATQTRLREFLNQATNVEEALEVNSELSRIEEEINITLGRINYLSDRAAFSTISLQLTPVLPTPTPTPLPTPQSWRPADTAQTALVTLQDTAQTVGDGAIYFGIVCLPWLLPLLVVGGIGLRLMRRRRRSTPAPPAAPPSDN